MKPLRTIDSHQHFWQLSRGDYDWLTPTPSLAPLYRDFLPIDLQPHLAQLNIHGTILVQAAATMSETKFMLDLATQNAFILGVVGWVEMTAPEAPDHIATFAEHQKFCGIRPLLQDIPDVDWMLRKDITPSLNTLAALDLTFDALVLPKHLANLIRLLERHPTLKIVIDHGAKPLIKAGLFQPWANDIKTIASFPQVHCKLSGLLTEADPNASPDKLLPYMDHLFACFGHERLMWGSDFPVLNLVSNYADWHAYCIKYMQKIDGMAMNNVFGEVAARFYQV